MPEKGAWGLDFPHTFIFKQNLLEGKQELSMEELINL